MGGVTNASRRVGSAAPVALPPPRRVFLGRHPRVLDLMERLEKLAPLDQPLLLLGETGTGKELLARLIHAASDRATGPFVAVNCAALPPGTVESELFGAARGSYTGADAAREGLIEAAHGGTLFLDEVGDMPPAAQAALLRSLEERTVRRLGEVAERPVDFRLVAATHCDLDGPDTSFRRDLRWRLGHALEVPSLRERATDIPLLVRCFLEEFAAGRPPLRVDGPAMAALVRHPYPGNVRELRCRLSAAAAMARDGLLRAEDLELPPQGTPLDGRSLLAGRRGSGLPVALVPSPLPEDCILALLAGGAEAGIAAIVEACRLPRRTTQRVLHDLVGAGRILRRGRGPATRYRIPGAPPVVTHTPEQPGPSWFETRLDD